MTLKEFTNSINTIQKYRKTEEMLSKVFDNLSEMQTYGLLGKIEIDYVKLLEIATNDKDSWIAYYLYDCDMGKKPLEVTSKNKKFKLKTIEQLYSLIY